MDAENLYEALAIAVVQYREDDVCPCSGAMTELTIAVEHKIRLGQYVPVGAIITAGLSISINGVLVPWQVILASPGK